MEILQARKAAIAVIVAKLPHLTNEALGDLVELLPTLRTRDPNIVLLEGALERLRVDLSNAGDRRDSDSCDRIDREIVKVNRLLAKAKKKAAEA